MPALILGIVAAIFYEFFIPAIIAVVLGAKGLNRAEVLKGESVEKTGKGLSMAGLILGIVYLFTGFIAATTEIV